MSDWWLSRASGAPEGPFPSQTLVQGLISGQVPNQAYVCRVGAQQWLVISQVDELWEAAFPEQAKTKVTEQPWFAQSPEVQTSTPATSLEESAGKVDGSRILTPLPIVTPQGEPATAPLQTRALASRPAKADGAPALPGANPVPAPRALPTPLPKSPHAAEPRPSTEGSLRSPPTASANTNLHSSTLTTDAYRAKVPTLEGIQGQDADPPVRPGTGTGERLSGALPNRPPSVAKGVEARLPSIGLSPLPKPSLGNQRSPLGALPAPLPARGTRGAVLPQAVALAPPQPRPSAPTAAGAPLQPLPAILGVSSLNVGATTESLASGQPSPDAMLSALADGDEVTRLVSPALVVGRDLPEAGDDDVTTIVTGPEHPTASDFSQRESPDDETTTAIRTTVANVTDSAAAQEHAVRGHGSGLSEVDGRAGAAPISPPHSTNSNADVSGPEDLLEADIDDSSARIHSVPPIQPVARAKKVRPIPAGPPSSPTGPVISVPPKATHVAAAPSIVLRPEPVVHQEATKPAVRALKPPGVIQISYGTLVVAVLVIALLILLVVLVK
ncbi:MAG: GYF domain-containing protein [Polyangiaceae bacterium]